MNAWSRRMPPFMDAVQAVHDFAQQPITTYSALPPTDPQFLSGDCFRDLMVLCHSATPSERNEVLAELAATITTTPDIFQASRVAMLCGILVEWQADSSIAIAAILERLTAQLPAAASIADRVNATNEAELFAAMPDALKAWKGLRYMVLPAMTMLCIDVAARRSARQNSRFLDAVRELAPVHADVKFLHRLLNFTDGEELIVLHPAEIKGFRVRLEAVASNFHLFTLLQDVLVGDPSAGLLPGPRANRKVIATATGAMPHDRLITDAPVWHYWQWPAFASDAVPSPETLSIAGEKSPREIPLFDGEPVLLLSAPIGGERSWDSSFFTNLHDALRSNVEVIEILSAGEVETRLRRMRGVR